VAIQKRRITNRKITRFNRFKRFCTLVGILATTAFGSCSSRKPDLSKAKPVVTSKAPEKKLRFRCYDYKDKKLRVYVEDRSIQRKGKELGSEHLLQFSQLRIDENTPKPLAYFCNHDGHLFWVTANSVYIKKLKMENNGLVVGRELDVKIRHSNEFTEPTKTRLNVDIWKNPNKRWEDIPVAIITNTGFFQVARFSENAIARGKLDRAVIDLKSAQELRIEDRWHNIGVEQGVVKVLSGNGFSIIPLGIRGVGKVGVFYYLKFKGKPKDSFKDMKKFIETTLLYKRKTNLKNIFSISQPARFDGEQGGWVINLLGEDKNGKVIHLFPRLID
jgi:hypothetical protein